MTWRSLRKFEAVASIWLIETTTYQTNQTNEATMSEATSVALGAPRVDEGRL
jgi:hypothetical protein